MSGRVMVGMVSCRARKPWSRIVRLAEQGRRIPDLCLEFNVTRAEIERELRKLRVCGQRAIKSETPSPAPVPSEPKISEAPPPPPPSTPTRRRAATNAKPPVCSDEEVRALLQADRVSWNEAAWLMRTDIQRLRQRAADEGWSAPVKIRRHAPASEATVIAKVTAGRLSADIAAETLGVPVELVARRVRRA
jgi:hypothetical protein